MQALSSPECTKVVAVNLMNQFVMRAVGSSRVLYEMERWHLTTEDIGWLASYRSLVGILSSWLVSNLLTRRFGTWTLLYGATCASAAAYILESVPGEALLPGSLGSEGSLHASLLRQFQLDSLQTHLFLSLSVHAYQCTQSQRKLQWLL